MEISQTNATNEIDYRNPSIYNCDAMHLLSTLKSASVDCLITDPPYGFLKHKIETGVDIPAFFEEVVRVVKPNGFILFFGQQPTLTKWNYHALEKKLKFKAEVIWYKKNATYFLGDMTRWYENISIFINGDGVRFFNPVKRPYIEVKNSLADFSEKESLYSMISALTRALRSENAIEKAVKRIELDKDIFNSDRRHQNDEIHMGSFKDAESFLSDVNTAIKGLKAQNFVSFDYTKSDSFVVSFTPHNLKHFSKYKKVGCFDEFNLNHPTVKPVALIEWLILLLTNENDIIVDPYLGTGTTAIAARNTKRKFIGSEIDSGYFDIILNRLKQPINLISNEANIDCDGKKIDIKTQLSLL